MKSGNNVGSERFYEKNSNLFIKPLTAYIVPGLREMDADDVIGPNDCPHEIRNGHRKGVRTAGRKTSYSSESYYHHRLCRGLTHDTSSAICRRLPKSSLPPVRFILHFAHTIIVSALALLDFAPPVLKTSIPHGTFYGRNYIHVSDNDGSGEKTMLLLKHQRLH